MTLAYFNEKQKGSPFPTRGDQISVMQLHLAKAAALSALLVIASIACCQEPAEETSGAGSVVVGVTPAGVQRFSRGGWSSMAVNGVNKTDQDSDEIVSVYLGDEAGLQFSKRFWVPAGAKRKTWLPILIPADIPQTATTVYASTMRLKESASGESFTENSVGMSVSQRSLLLAEREINTGVITNSSLPGRAAEEMAAKQFLFDLIHAGRDSIGKAPLDLGLVDLRANFLPPTPHALQELDQVVIAGDRISLDTAGLAQLRAWLHQGGRIWIMLDRVDPSFVRNLLGDDVTYSVVDRVEWNEFTIDSEATLSEGARSETWESEKPVEMLRVLANVDEVTASIDGWPAMFWQSVGRGEVVCTTLAGRGWLDPRDTPTNAYYRLAQRFFRPTEPATSHDEALVPILDDKIGYRIPSRALAGAVLGINAVLILVAGCWWARKRRLERLAILIPVSTIASTAILIFVGNRQVSAVPSTAATGQIIRVADGVGEAHVSNLSAVYAQDDGELELVSSYRTITMPKQQQGLGQLQRVRWEDDGKSRWYGLQQPPGAIRYFQSEAVVPLQQPMVVRGTFDAEGFRGTIFGIEGKPCEDGLIISGPAPCTAVSFSDNADAAGHRVRGSQADLMAAGQYIPGALLSENQQLRQDFLRRVLADASQSPFSFRPTLLVWTDPIDLGVDIDSRFTQHGTSLAAIPIEIEHPGEGDFQIPATFVQVDTFASQRGRSMVFNPRSGKWLPQLTKGADVELVCRFPRSLMPLTLKSIDVYIKINAPGRFLVVKAMIDGTPTEVFRQADPTDLIRATIDQPAALQLNQQGGLWLQVSVSDSKQETDGEEQEDKKKIKTTWQIDRLYVDAIGTQPSTSSEVNAPASTAAGTP